MDVESGLLLGAISALATVVVYLWRRLEMAHNETRKELIATRELLDECRQKMAARVAKLEEKRHDD